MASNMPESFRGEFYLEMANPELPASNVRLRIPLVSLIPKPASWRAILGRLVSHS